MYVRNNLAAKITLGNLNKTNRLMEKRLEKLSSGFRINRAADDAAGLAISEKMRALIRGLSQAQRNAQDGISLVQTAESALGNIGDMLQRIRELAVQSANGTYTDTDRNHIQNEVAELKKAIDGIASSTEFNGMTLLDGSFAKRPAIPPTSKIDVTTGGTGKNIYDGDIPLGTNGVVVRLNPDEYINPDEDYAVSVNWVNGVAESLTIHKIPSGTVVTLNNPGPTFSINGVTFDISNASNGTVTGSQPQGVVRFYPGNNSPIPAVDNSLVLQVGPEAGQTLKIDIDDYRLSALNLNNLAVVPRSKAIEAIGLVDAALDKVLQGRSKLGASQNRLEHIINNLSAYEENLSASESRIRDADMAKEMVEYTKTMILAQAGQAVLAQANVTPQQVLSLLQ